jgi:hypothetical protein
MMIDERLVRMARAICIAALHDPDQMVFEQPCFPVGAKGRFLADGARAVPSWQLFLNEARAALDIVENP